MKNVAMGPRKSEISHHNKPLRPLDWARPALMRVIAKLPKTKRAGRLITKDLQIQILPAHEEQEALAPVAA